jgi:hypothetical protein
MPSVRVTPVIFTMSRPVFKKLVVYIMTPEPISTACFINPSNQSVCVCVCVCVCMCIPLCLLGYRYRGLGSIPVTTRKKVVGLERGQLSLVSTTEELLGRKVAAPV